MQGRSLSRRNHASHAKSQTQNKEAICSGGGPRLINSTVGQKGWTSGNVTVSTARSMSRDSESRTVTVSGSQLQRPALLAAGHTGKPSGPNRQDIDSFLGRAGVADLLSPEERQWLHSKNDLGIVTTASASDRRRREATRTLKGQPGQSYGVGHSASSHDRMRALGVAGVEAATPSFARQGHQRCVETDAASHRLPSHVSTDGEQDQAAATGNSDSRFGLARWAELYTDTTISRETRAKAAIAAASNFLIADDNGYPGPSSPSPWGLSGSRIQAPGGPVSWRNPNSPGTIEPYSAAEFSSKTRTKTHTTGTTHSANHKTSASPSPTRDHNLNVNRGSSGRFGAHRNHGPVVSVSSSFPVHSNSSLPSRLSPSSGGAEAAQSEELAPVVLGKFKTSPRNDTDSDPTMEPTTPKPPPDVADWIRLRDAEQKEVETVDARKGFLVELFSVCDVDGTNVCDGCMISGLFRALGHPLATSKLLHLLHLVDPQATGQLSFSMFTDLIMRSQVLPKLFPRNQVPKFDKLPEGTADNIRTVARSYRTRREIVALMFTRIDTDESGTLDIDEIRHAMKSMRLENRNKMTNLVQAFDKQIFNKNVIIGKFGHNCPQDELLLEDFIRVIDMIDDDQGAGGV